MAKSVMSTEERMELLAYLETVLGCVKTMHAGLGEVMADIATIRANMFEEEGELETCKSHLRRAVATAKPMVDQALRSYDDLLEEIVDSQRWQN